MVMITKYKYVWLVLLTLGLIGFWASLSLTVDYYRLLENPSYELACDINPIVSCGSVMESQYAKVFGVPLSLGGVIAFGSLMLFSLGAFFGIKYKPWIWRAAQLAVIAGLLIAHYLFFVSVTILGSICPWCFTVWMSTLGVAWIITWFNSKNGNIAMPKTEKWLAKNHAALFVWWLAVLLIIILIQFREFWRSLV